MDLTLKNSLIEKKFNVSQIQNLRYTVILYLYNWFFSGLIQVMSRPFCFFIYTSFHLFYIHRCAILSKEFLALQLNKNKSDHVLFLQIYIYIYVTVENKIQED